MMTSALSISIGDQPAVLYPERAVYFPQWRTLMISDTHFGKTAAFRASMIPVSDADTMGDLARLTRVINFTQPERLIILGDLVHCYIGYTARVIHQLIAWRAQHADLPILLVRGNHDLGAGDPPPELAITCMNAPYPFESFHLSHYPDVRENGYVLAGHLHPAAAMRGKGAQRLKLPCFWFGKQVGVLPAFGGFISHMVIQPQRGDQTYVITDSEVIGV